MGDIILEMKEMYGHRGRHIRTQEDAEKFWEQFAFSAGFRAGRDVTAVDYGSVILRHDDTVVVPYVNEGRWVADCLCRGGIACQKGIPVGCCLDCGTVYHLGWSGGEAEIEEALRPRSPGFRNWLPGEPVAVIYAENVEHGVVDPRSL